ncbi:MAG: type II toxin-antitoxin system VapC family toxin [Patescibacteria group bacterium]
MGKIKTIGIDTMLFIYHFQQHPQYFSSTQRIFSQVEKGDIEAVTSFISYLESCSLAELDGKTSILQQYKALFQEFPNLKTMFPNYEISEIAAKLRRKYEVAAPDALQIATAISAGAEEFITNDKKLLKIKEIKVVLL